MIGIQYQVLCCNEKEFLYIVNKKRNKTKFLSLIHWFSLTITFIYFFFFKKITLKSIREISSIMFSKNYVKKGKRYARKQTVDLHVIYPNFKFELIYVYIYIFNNKKIIC